MTITRESGSSKDAWRRLGISVVQDMENIAKIIAGDVKWHESPGTSVGGDYNGWADILGGSFDRVRQDWH